MTNKPNQDWLGQIVAATTGRRILGGCEDCNAYQTMDRTEDGVYHIHIHHDPDCPFLTGVTR